MTSLSTMGGSAASHHQAEGKVNHLVPPHLFTKNMKDYKKYIPTAIVIHHEGASNGLEAVDRYHKTRWPNFKSSLGYWIGYTHYISLDGTITQTRAEDEEGAHCLGGWNRKSVGICLRGHLGLQRPTEAQIKALRGLTEQVRIRWKIPLNRIYTHKELWITACPGKYGIEIVEEIREVKPDVRKLEKQISLILEAIEILRLRLIIARLKVAIKALLKIKQ